MFEEPDPAIQPIGGAPGTRFPTIWRVGEIDSTNRYLLDAARRGAGDSSVLIADHQTAGRGRLGRTWSAPPSANLLMSVLFRTALDPADLHLYTVALALAAADACAELAGVEAGIKWPNDLLVGDRKLAGVLAEADLPQRPSTGTVPAGIAPSSTAPSTTAPSSTVVVAGIGLNVLWPDSVADVAGSELAKDALQATSLKIESGRSYLAVDLARYTLRSLSPRIDALESAQGRAGMAQELGHRCVTLGREVRVTTGSGELVGLATGITPQGHLAVQVGDRSVEVVAGDVFHVRSEA